MMIKNNIPGIAEKRGITPTELHRKTISLSWPTVLGLASQERAPKYLPERTGISTLVQLALALNCEVSDLYSVEV